MIVQVSFLLHIKVLCPIDNFFLSILSGALLSDCALFSYNYPSYDDRRENIVILFWLPVNFLIFLDEDSVLSKNNTMFLDISISLSSIPLFWSSMLLFSTGELQEKQENKAHYKIQFIDSIYLYTWLHAFIWLKQFSQDFLTQLKEVSSSNISQ